MAAAATALRVAAWLRRGDAVTTSRRAYYAKSKQTAGKTAPPPIVTRTTTTTTKKSDQHSEDKESWFAAASRSSAMWAMRHPILLGMGLMGSAMLLMYHYRKSILSDSPQLSLLKVVAGQSELLRKHLLVDSADELKWRPMPNIRVQNTDQIVEIGVEGNNGQRCTLVAVFELGSRPPKLKTLLARFAQTIDEGDLGMGFTIVGERNYLEQQHTIEHARRRLTQPADSFELAMSPDQIAEKVRHDRLIEDQSAH